MPARFADARCVAVVLDTLPWSRLAVRSEVDLREIVAAALDRIEDAGAMEAWELEASIDRALIARFGGWAAGWRWSVHDGGPVHAYCCSGHSLHRGDEKQRRAAALRVGEALIEWRALLEELATRFEALATSCEGLTIEGAVERAAAQLLPLVLERTGVSDAWYSTFVQFVIWQLEASGHDADVARRVVPDVVRGPFQSWIEPPSNVASDVCARLGVQMALAAEGTPFDALSQWQVARVRAFGQAPSSRSPEAVRQDGHQAFIERFDRARYEARADRMNEALAACRASARAGEPLTLERLVAWQSIVLGNDAPLRVRDAFAKRGRERYGFDARTMPELVRALAQTESNESAVVRAARVYLDVAFFHPFEDGNARAARLAMDHVLTRADLALHAAEPVFVVSRAAADVDGAGAFVRLLDYLTGPVDYD